MDFEVINMKKLLATILITCFTNTYAGLPPTTLTGEQGSPNQTTFNFKAPNYQATQSSSGVTRIETGNTNQLVNPSFEASNPATGWTVSGGTTSAGGALVDGKQSLTIATTGVISVYQSVSVYSSNLVGQSGIASIWINMSSSITDMQVCVYIGGVDTSCVPYTQSASNIAGGRVTIPFTFTTQSAGIHLKTTASYPSQQVQLDDAFVGLQNTGILPSTMSVDTDWVSYTPALTGFGTVSAPASNYCKYRRIGGDLAVECFFTSGTSTAVLASIALPTGLTLDTSRIVASNTTSGGGQSFGTMAQTTSGALNQIVSAVGTSTSLLYFGNSLTNSGSSVLVPQNGSATVNSSSNMSMFFLVPITGWSVNTTTFSAQSQNYDWTPYTPTISGISGFTPASNPCAHMRIGGNLYIRCSFTNVGTSSATQMQLSLPSGLTVNSSVLANTLSGGWSSSSANTYYGTILIQPSVTYLNFGLSSSGGLGLTPQNANTVLSSSSTFSFQSGPIPILGWSNVSTITASLGGVPTVPGLSTLVDTFSVSYGTTNSTTTCSASPCSYLDQIGNAVSSITRSSAGTYSLNTTKTYTKLKCILDTHSGSGTGWMGAASSSLISCSSCNTLAFSTITSTFTSATDSNGTLFCQGQQ